VFPQGHKPALINLEIRFPGKSHLAPRFMQVTFLKKFKNGMLRAKPLFISKTGLTISMDRLATHMLHKNSFKARADRNRLFIDTKPEFVKPDVGNFLYVDDI